MKLKRVVSVALAVFLLVSAIAVPAMAYVDASVCTINKVGYDPRFSGAMVQLTHNSTIPKWTGIRTFYLSSALGNQGLAVLLTALSMGKTVWVRIAGDGAAGSQIEIIHINN